MKPLPPPPCLVLVLVLEAILSQGPPRRPLVGYGSLVLLQTQAMGGAQTQVQPAPMQEP